MGEAGSKHVSTCLPHTRSNERVLVRGCTRIDVSPPRAGLFGLLPPRPIPSVAATNSFCRLRCVTPCTLRCGCCLFARDYTRPLVPSLTDTHLRLAKPLAPSAAVRCILRLERQRPQRLWAMPFRGPAMGNALPFPWASHQRNAVSQRSHTDSNLRALRSTAPFPTHPSPSFCARGQSPSVGPIPCHSWENAHTHSCSRWVGGKTHKLYWSFCQESRDCKSRI